MQFLLVGDQHFRNELPYGAAFKDGRRSEWNAVKKAIHRAAEECDAVVLMGDNLNSRHNHSSVIREFVDFLNGFGGKDIYIIAGNHERYGTSTAIDFLREIKNEYWHVFTEVTTVDLGARVTFMPYMTAGSLGVKDNAEALASLLQSAAGGDILFTHHTISGSKWNGGSAEHLNEPVLPREVLESRYTHIFGGHIHQQQRLSEQTLVVGNIFPSEVGEVAKSVYIYDTRLNQVIDIPLPVRGIYKTEVADHNLFTGLRFPKASIVKVVITDREANVDLIRRLAKEKFDASIIVEQYPRERSKVHFEEGTLDLTVDNMLKVYSEARKVEYNDLKEGFDLIRS